MTNSTTQQIHGERFDKLTVPSEVEEQSRTMTEFLKYAFSFLVEEKKAIKIEESPAREGEFVNVSVSVAKKDMGRVIGRQGNIIQALRNLVNVLGVKEGRNFFLVLSEDNYSPLSLP